MQRLVYSPKIQAFVKTDSGVIDLTDFIVSGTVSRVVNEVSTAELVIRNPGKRFTQPGNPTFLPMDPITIFGSRFKNRPVQMFTGYLDTAPYLQLYPGTCTLRASCTLKRLLYTYWDAGLPHTLEFLSKYNWVADLQSGTIRNPQADSDRSKKKNSTDGSVGDLMFAVLKEIGQWDDNQILIESFPKDADDIVQGLVEDITGNVTEAQNQFEKFLSDIIGQYSGGVGTGTSSPVGVLSGNNNPQKVFNYFVSVGLSAEQAAGVVGNMMQESYPEINPESEGTGGCGIIGWTPCSKLSSELQAYGIKGPTYELETQVNLVWQEMSHPEKGAWAGTPFSLSHYKKINNVRDATTYFCTEFERAGDPQMDKRIAYASAVYQKYKKDAGTPYVGGGHPGPQ